MAYHRFYGVRTNIARIFNTYGPRMKLDDGRVVPAFLDQALRCAPMTIFGDGSQTRSFCYVSDLVDGLYRLMQSEERYPVNLGNPREMTILEFAAADSETGGHREPDRIPAAAGRRSEETPSRHFQGQASAGLGTEGAARRRIAGNDRVFSRARRERDLAEVPGLIVRTTQLGVSYPNQSPPGDQNEYEQSP